VYQGREVDFTPPWRRLTVYDGIQEYAGLDVEKMSDDELYKKAKEFGADLEKKPSRGELIMTIFEQKVEHELWHPTFVRDFPVEMSPVTKMHREKKGLGERFEPMCCGMEIGNAYTELNDPEEQLARLKAQEEKRVVDEEAHPMDEDFMNAIDVGMPPTGGV